MTLTPSTGERAATDEPASTSRAPRVGPARKRRIVAMTIWAVVFVGLLFAIGLPTDPVYAFVWLWALTIAWHSDRPWRSHLGFARDWAMVVLLLVVYNISRGVADDVTSLHVTEMIHADEWMFGWLTGGVVPTVWLQHHLYHVPLRWYDTIVAFVYFSHFVATLIAAVVLWLRNRARWVSYIRRWVTLTALGLATYFLYPAAPPWWASERGYLEPIHVGGATRGWGALGLHGAGNLLNAAKLDAANPVAAMPSLHSAYSLFVIVFFLPAVRKRWWPLLLAYPLAMMFTLVYTGEHYVTDVFVGWFYVAVTMVGVWAVEKGWAAWRRRHAQPAPATAEVGSGPPRPVVTGVPSVALANVALASKGPSSLNGSSPNGSSPNGSSPNGSTPASRPTMRGRSGADHAVIEITDDGLLTSRSTHEDASD